MSKPFDLERFVEAQDRVFSHVLDELRTGAKRSHWMWFVFPQLRGLGSSSMAQTYGLESRAEAGAFVAHPVLGPRLTECARLVNAVQGRAAEQIFGPLDAVKFRSSMTLFAAVAGDESVFADALRKYFDGEGDSITLAKLG